ncbi:MarR family winged helix-turn-helix transcriptional regulator [Streptomyces canus]|uniref:MarR family winged helix-turn-helix transcriptional regulator n=1 Tax=Streptomyces canus TaxID=58343 RepID=UPI002DDC3FB7|nr:MarR family winged helix-turn-helix transcriptional regulator [Streptomyces canus]WSD91732.1 MarR family winged helix-turn-helix transcriptional regulator [Streptomyces canus]
MGNDAFAHHGLGSAALLIISALHQRPDQTVGELVGTSSVSRATTYRTLRCLADHGLVHHTGETWALAPRALEGFGIRLPNVDNGHTPAQGWDHIAELRGTRGVAAQRKALHVAERAAYQQALDRLAEHRAGLSSSSATATQSWSQRRAPTRSRPRGTPPTGASSTRSLDVRPPTGGSPPTAA